MHVTFYGAVREVTGSLHMLDTGTDRILFDCGMYQGRRKESEIKNRSLPFDSSMITNLVLSHAHIDHCGRIPLLTKNGFTGRVLCTRATADSCDYLLKDAAHIQVSDADYLNYKTLRSAMFNLKERLNGKPLSSGDRQKIKRMLKGNDHRLKKEVINELMDKYRLAKVEPLYTMEEAEDALSNFEGIPYRRPVIIGQDTTCTFFEAGHILGSAVSVVEVKKDGRTCRIGYTGDIGRFDKPILKDPSKVFSASGPFDLLIMESTYGDREHEPTADLEKRLLEVLRENEKNGGCLLIPSFAFGRTQEILYVLHKIYDQGITKRIPVYIDSPLATNLTKVFAEHPELYDEQTHEDFLKKGENPFSFRELRFVSSVEESMALNRDQNPHIVISASGMCEAGRILHHLRHKIHNPANTILIVGYMAQHTLGRRIENLGMAYEAEGRKGPAPILKFFNKEYPLKAHVRKIDGFSAHADRNELIRFLKESGLNVKRIAVVHGEEDQSKAFADLLNNKGYQAFVPRQGESIYLEQRSS